MTLYKIVNGEQVELTQEEIDYFQSKERTPEEALQQEKDIKIEALLDFHYEDENLRVMTVTTSTPHVSILPLSLKYPDRELVLEQIKTLEIKISLGEITEEEAVFNYKYEGIDYPFTLIELRTLWSNIMNIVQLNYNTLQDHISNINNLSTIEEVNNYDYEAGYLINQNLFI